MEKVDAATPKPLTLVYESFAKLEKEKNYNCGYLKQVRFTSNIVYGSKSITHEWEA